MKLWNWAKRLIAPSVNTQAIARAPEEEYLASFAGTIDKNSRQLKALELALDIRKFEIELYWKRAAYFWAFTAVAFGAYITISGAEKFQNQSNALLLVSCVGLLFSIAWYFVNRASKFWQNNWEKHVDLLEDHVVGPLYKTVLSNNDAGFWRLHSAFPFSVSKINQLLSLFLVFVFVILLLETLRRYFTFAYPPEFFPTSCIVLTLLFIGIIYKYGKSGLPDASVSMALRTTTLQTDSRIPIKS